MKYLGIVSVYLLLSHFSDAQKKLKMDITKSGDTLWSTSEEKIYNKPGSSRSAGDYLKSSIYKRSTGFSLCLSIQTGRTSVFTIGEGSVVEIKFTDGSTATLTANTDNSSRTLQSYYGCYIFAFYRLNSKLIRQLKSTPISLIRVNASIGNMDYEIKEKFSDAIMDQLAKF